MIAIIHGFLLNNKFLNFIVKNAIVQPLMGV